MTDPETTFPHPMDGTAHVRMAGPAHPEGMREVWLRYGSPAREVLLARYRNREDALNAAGELQKAARWIFEQGCQAPRLDPVSRAERYRELREQGW